MATDARVLSAYYGLDALPASASLACVRRVTGEDGMPVTFSVRLDAATVTADAFAVETATGEFVTPVCATLRPATEPLERRTVLLAGAFGTPDAPPRAVIVVGALEDGSVVVPTVLVDDDPDNFVLACLDAPSPARSVAVAAGLFHDPGNDANPATAVDVVAGGGAE